MRLTALALACTLATPAAAQAILFAEATPEEDATIAEAFFSMLMDAELDGAMLFIGAARVDLDGDGADELLGMLQSATVCGAETGCPVGVFKGSDATGWRLVTTLDAAMLTVGPGTTRGWRDLTLGTVSGDRRFRWTGEGYAPG